MPESFIFQVFILFICRSQGSYYIVYDDILPEDAAHNSGYHKPFLYNNGFWMRCTVLVSSLFYSGKFGNHQDEKVDAIAIVVWTVGGGLDILGALHEILVIKVFW